jgi:hypothetical protein
MQIDEGANYPMVANGITSISIAYLVILQFWIMGGYSDVPSLFSPLIGLSRINAIFRIAYVHEKFCRLYMSFSCRFVVFYGPVRLWRFYVSNNPLFSRGLCFRCSIWTQFRFWFLFFLLCFTWAWIIGLQKRWVTQERWILSPIYWIRHNFIMFTLRLILLTRLG